MTELKAVEVKPEEIRQAVGQMLQDFGVDRPREKGNREGKVKETCEVGADRQEIREQVNAMLKGFGLEVSKKKRGGKRGFRGPSKGQRRYNTLGRISLIT